MNYLTPAIYSNSSSQTSSFLILQASRKDYYIKCKVVKLVACHFKANTMVHRSKSNTTSKKLRLQKLLLVTFVIFLAHLLCVGNISQDLNTIYLFFKWHSMKMTKFSKFINNLTMLYGQVVVHCQNSKYIVSFQYRNKLSMSDHNKIQI